MPKSKPVGLFLEKANQKGIAHCVCAQSYIGAPAQQDCPWCGCGWLFICPTCRRAFTFARAVKCDLTWEQLAHHDIDGHHHSIHVKDEVKAWIKLMQTLTKDIELGKEYIYIDGSIFATDQVPIVFDGVHARHELDQAPQVHALRNKKALEQSLGSDDYWSQRDIRKRAR